MRGTACRLPYWPWLMRIGLSSPSRSGIVSWSASNEIATAQRAPPGQAAGARLRPARARPTMRRQTGSAHCQGSPSGECTPSLIARSALPADPARERPGAKGGGKEPAAPFDAPCPAWNLSVLARRRSTEDLDIRFDGRVVLVSGAAQGIGQAIARGFRDAGARLHLADIDPAVVQAGAELGTAAHVQDLSDRAGCAALVTAILAAEGRLDILALAAGGVCGQAGVTLDAIEEEGWNQVFAANVKGALWLSQAAAPTMQSAGWGRIVTVSSGAGLRPSLTGLHAYTAAKHALIGLTKQLSVSLAQHGITANSVAPGLILSNPATHRQWAAYGPDGQQRQVDSLHTRRMGEPEDIANAVLFFASEQAGWITGQVLSVDGGRS